MKTLKFTNDNAIQILKDKISSAELWEYDLQFKRDAFIKSENTVDTNLYFLEEGSVRVYFREDTYEHTLYFGYKKSLISALDSFLTNETSQLCIQAIKKTRVKVISQSTFFNFIRKEEETLTLWQKVLSELLLRQIEREKDLLISSPTQRYQRVLNRHPLLFHEVPHKYIASYLRMTPETLSRIQKS